MSEQVGPLRRAWRSITGGGAAQAPPSDDDPEKAGLAKELMTLRVRTIYATRGRPEFEERSNRLRLFALSRLYAEYLDGVAQEPIPRDLFGGMTTFTELADQARTLLEEEQDDLSAPEAELLARIQRESTRIVREVFHPRRRGALVRERAEGEGALDLEAERQIEAMVTSAPDHGHAPASALPEPTDMPLAFMTMNQEVEAHEDTGHDLDEADPEWLRKLYAANASWDNELFADGQTTLPGVDPDLLPPALRKTRRYPPLTLSRRQELLLQRSLELGTDLVAVQSSMSLTGDVITRISPHLPEEHRALFLELHRDGTANALAHWSHLIQALQTFLSGLFDAAFGRDDP